MKATRYLLLLLTMLVGMVARGQDFNPTSPAEPSSRYQLRVKANPAEAATVSGAGKYAVNTRVSVSSTPSDTKWQFVKWTDGQGNEVSTNSSFTYTTTNDNVTLTAHYREVPVSTLAIRYDPSSISSGSTKEYKAGSSVSVSCSTYNYYGFLNWTNSKGEVVSTNRSFTYTTTEDDEVLTAHYVFSPSNPSEPTETKPKYKVYLSANPAGAGSFNMSNGAQVSDGSTFSVTTTAGTGYEFVNWTQDGQQVGDSRTYSARMNGQDITLVANFRFRPADPSDPGSSNRVRHTLYAPTTEVYKGEQALLPIYLENTGDVRELSFGLVLPDGVEADVDAIQTTLRTSAYTAQGAMKGDTLMVTLSGGTQIGERNGVIVRIPVVASGNMEDGEYPVLFGAITATLADGSQATVTNRRGKLQVSTLEEGDLQAQFSVDRYMNRAQFTNLSTESARSFLWEFGDGTTSTEQNPMHIYQAAGTYNVRLTARGIVKTDVAEQTIVVNPASTWTANGDYTLDAQAHGARNFTSLHEAIDLLSQCTPDGDITIAVSDGDTYRAYLTAEDSLLMVCQLGAKLQNAGVKMTFTSNVGQDKRDETMLNLYVNEVDEDMQAVISFLKEVQAVNVSICVNGAYIYTSEIGKYESQVVCAGVETEPVTFTSISPLATVRWTASVTAGCVLKGYETTGEGDLPSMTILNPGTKTDVISYHVNVMLGNTVMESYIYKVSVKPQLSAQTLNLTAPADKAEVAHGNVTLQWTNLNALSVGYTVHLTRTLADNEVESEVHVTTNSYVLNALPGATYQWWVTAHGECDNAESQQATFSVRKQADLVVDTVMVPKEPKANTEITVSAVIRNAGEGSTQRSSWSDALYWSTQPDDLAGATLLGTRQHSGVLEPDGSYTATWKVTTPDAGVGEIYYYVKADYSDNERESVELNNTTVSEVVSIVSKFVTAGDYSALKRLYQATNGEAWLKTWKINSDAITSTAWPGVTFDEDGNVISISLSGNNMKGDLPAEGFVLPCLKSLNLSSNSLKGDVAAFCQGLTALESLNLSHCLLTEVTDVLPTSITQLDLGYQRDAVSILTFPIQEWTMGDADANIDLSSLIAYDHSAQDFEAHPRLQLRTAQGNTYVGALQYAGDAYAWHLNGEYRQPSGTEYVVQPTEGPAAYTRMRARVNWITGDANVDASVDVLDAQHTLNYILGTQSGNFNFMAADTYTSGHINVQDVVATINLFIDDDLPLSSAEKHQARMREMGEQPVGEVRLTDDGTLWLDASQPVAALDITLQGVRASQVALRLNRSRYQMVAHDTRQGVRVVVISPTGDAVSGSMAVLGISGDASITHVNAADVDARAMYLAVDASTGVDTLDADGGDAPLYDLSGRRVERATRGMYIRNGKKIVKK